MRKEKETAREREVLLFHKRGETQRHIAEWLIHKLAWCAVRLHPEVNGTWQWATCGTGLELNTTDAPPPTPNYCPPWHWSWTNAIHSFETSSNEALLPRAPEASNYCFAISAHLGNSSLIQMQPVQSNYYLEHSPKVSYCVASAVLKIYQKVEL